MRLITVLAVALVLLAGCGSPTPQPPLEKPELQPHIRQKMEREAVIQVETKLANKTETVDGVYVKTFTASRTEPERVDGYVNEFLRGEGRKHLAIQSHLADHQYAITIIYEYKKPPKKD